MLDCFVHPEAAEKYEVMLCKHFCFHTTVSGRLKDGPDELRNTYVQGLSMSEHPTHPTGISLWFEMSAPDAATYRYRVKHRRVRWLDLPENIRGHVIARTA